MDVEDEEILHLVLGRPIKGIGLGLDGIVERLVDHVQRAELDVVDDRFLQVVRFWHGDSEARSPDFFHGIPTPGVGDPLLTTALFDN